MSREQLHSDVDLECRLEKIELALYADLYEALPPEIARRNGIGCTYDQDEMTLTAQDPDHPFFNRILGIGLRRRPDAAWIDSRTARFREMGVQRWMLQILPHLEDTRMREELLARGLVRHRGWAKHLGVPEVMVRRSDVPRVEAIDSSQAVAFAQICAGGFGFPPSIEPWVAGTVGRPSWVHYLAFDAERPIACAALFVSDRTANLTFAATRPEDRGRGAQTALITRRMRDAASLGCRWVVSETDEETPDRPNPSARNLRRLGLPVQFVRANWGPPKPTEPN